MMKRFNAIEYLAIDIANQYGLDKETFESRIRWVRMNQGNLEDLTKDAETPMLYSKAVAHFRKALKGLPTGHTVALDSVCSGLQLMSVLTGCESGCHMSGLIDPDKRMDAYTEVTRYMDQLLQGNVNVLRSDAKQAVMTSLYGSMAKPREIFGDGTPEYKAFYEVLQTKAKGAYWLLGVLKQVWQSTAYAHSWVLPDGYQAFIPNMVKQEARVNVSELDYTMSVISYENEPQEKGISLPANVIHSVDAYLLRSLVRRCNYDPKVIRRASDLIEARLIEYGLSNNEPDGETDPGLEKYIELWRKNQIADVVILPHITASNVWQIPGVLLKQLSAIIETMLKHEPFELITVHDSFACHPNHCNQVRYWYKEILADMADSTVLAAILSQIINKDAVVTKINPGLADKIRQSNYGLS